MTDSTTAPPNNYAERCTDNQSDHFDMGLELAWGLIANAWGGDWDLAPATWREAAERWRDQHYTPAASSEAAEKPPFGEYYAFPEKELRTFCQVLAGTLSTVMLPPTSEMPEQEIISIIDTAIKELAND